MTVYTKTYKAKRKAVATSQKKKTDLTSAQRKKVSQYKTATETLKAAEASNKAINEALIYVYKNKKTGKKDKKGKEITKKVKEKLKKPKKMNKTQKALFDKNNKAIDSSKDTISKLKNDKEYKQATVKIQIAKDKAKESKESYDKYMKKRHKKALSRIAKQRKQNYERNMQPHASIHATNSLTGLTVFVFASSESESNESNATTYPIDKDDPVVDHVQRSSKTITVDGYLFDQAAGKRIWSGKEDDDVSGMGLPNKNCQDQYNDLKKWQFDGTELVYKSNASKDSEENGMNKIYYKHLFMTSLSKTLDAPLKGLMKISMTFQFAYKATVKAGSKGKKMVETKYVGKKMISIKKGMTYKQIAKKYVKDGCTVKDLIKMNGPEKKAFKYDKKTKKYSGKHGNKLQVTKGQIAATMTGSPTTAEKVFNVGLNKKHFTKPMKQGDKK